MDPPLTPQVVTNHKVNETYVLFQCGASAPDLTAFPEGAKFFQVRACQGRRPHWCQLDAAPQMLRACDALSMLVLTS